ncbi:MAG: aminotransferase class V-fold PLP-dependent enzyme [Cyclobacteriaceae bacterium]|jgi:phosphoserine aminotransferase|nr:aminotransferase class V-fold PLP-dependent enzyme [Cyclobacteriaceae bacterium]
MKKKICLAPGPSELYFTVEGHVKAAFREGVPSLSHRSRLFEGYYRAVVDGLRALLNVPSDYTIAFTSSATEIWERSIQSLAAETSHHYINGAFSKRYFEIAKLSGKRATHTTVQDGSGFKTTLALPEETELIALTHNETSTGVAMPLAALHDVRAKNPTALIIVDAVSSLPYPNFDYRQVDSVFFSVQKGFGLPAGLGVWMFNSRCVEKSLMLQEHGKFIGTYHALPALWSYAEKNQTPSTPNVLAIYLLGKVIEDMLQKGIHAIRKETEYKAAVLYQALEKSGALKPFVADPEWRSSTVLVADAGERQADISTFLLERGFEPGEGYGAYKKSHLRFANFPTHSKEQYECLADAIGAWAESHRR